MPKFSQGEWKCNFEDNKYILGSNSEVLGELYFITPEETEANARLIAAAPEMYQHLKLILNGEFSSDDVEQLLARIDGEEVKA